ncbi:putative zinc-binding protein [Methanotrichaceae archaeon M04Ac]|uniref:Zinc-binding protein n=1 Tax=Candidatus Methanocrinis alkalitolerans TaxID=3033395 RepID=A0ABT5XED7_9EURY|nr:putative zinc-binding protein [Candidatus Methanocrinis alkalitolerans]MCR3884641.1 putative zinc-binding protein [Methanothrix sp.]MDF0593066.1 putative zinc-binding protein [Candidatus Methanocrinis alkalitolerans]
MLERGDERKEVGCLCASGDLLFLACAGGSNVGQISNQAAVELAKEGRGKLFCLAGIGAHLDTMIVAARERNLVAIDGCPVQCAKKILDHASLPAALAVVVTDLGIEKSPKLEVDPADCEKVVEKIKEGLKA